MPEPAGKVYSAPLDSLAGFCGFGFCGWTREAQDGKGWGKKVEGENG